MKKHIHISILCIALFFVNSSGFAKDNLLGSGGSKYSSKSAYAIRTNNGLRTGQYSGQHHLIGIYGQGAYSMAFHDASWVKNKPGGYSAGVGVIYEYQAGNFILQTGCGIRFHSVSNFVTDTSFFKFNVADTWTGQRDTFCYDLKYDFYQRKDSATMVHLEIPILAGMSFGGRYGNQYGRGYFLAGLKLQPTIWGKTFVRATGSTMGFYDRYLGIFREMDNHGLRKDVPIYQNHQGLKMQFDVLAHIEAGYEWANPAINKGYRNKSVLDWRLRVALFADVSLFSITPKTKETLIYIPNEFKWDFPKYEFHHAFASEDFSSCHLRNMFIGVRLTMLVGVQFKETCRICELFPDYRDERDPGKIRGRITHPYPRGKHVYHRRSHPLRTPLRERHR